MYKEITKKQGRGKDDIKYRNVLPQTNIIFETCDPPKYCPTNCEYN